MLCVHPNTNKPHANWGRTLGLQCKSCKRIQPEEGSRRDRSREASNIRYVCTGITINHINVYSTYCCTLVAAATRSPDVSVVPCRLVGCFLLQRSCRCHRTCHVRRPCVCCHCPCWLTLKAVSGATIHHMHTQVPSNAVEIGIGIHPHNHWFATAVGNRDSCRHIKHHLATTDATTSCRSHRFSLSLYLAA